MSSHFSEGYTVESKRKSAPPEHLLQNWGRFSNYFLKSRRWHDLLWLWWKKFRGSSAKAEGWKYKEETICLLFSFIFIYLFGGGREPHHMEDGILACRPQDWKHRVLTTGTQGSPNMFNVLLSSSPNAKPFPSHLSPLYSGGLGLDAAADMLRAL